MISVKIAEMLEVEDEYGIWSLLKLDAPEFYIRTKVLNSFAQKMNFALDKEINIIISKERGFDINQVSGKLYENNSNKFILIKFLYVTEV